MKISICTSLKGGSFRTAERRIIKDRHYNNEEISANVIQGDENEVVVHTAVVEAIMMVFSVRTKILRNPENKRRLCADVLLLCVLFVALHLLFVVFQ